MFDTLLCLQLGGGGTASSASAAAICRSNASSRSLFRFSAASIFAFSVASAAYARITSIDLRLPLWMSSFSSTCFRSHFCRDSSSVSS